MPIGRTNILQIPLHNLEEEDYLRWRARKDGQYTVRRGYFSILEWKRKKEWECSNINLDK